MQKCDSAGGGRDTWYLRTRWNEKGRSKEGPTGLCVREASTTVAGNVLHGMIGDRMMNWKNVDQSIEERKRSCGLGCTLSL